VDNHKNPELYDMVERLRSLRKIKKDADIVEQTGFSKGLVSNYINGRLKVSSNFMKKFKEVYGEYLNNVSHETPIPNNKTPKKSFMDYDKEIVSLKRNVTELQDMILKTTEELSNQDARIGKLERLVITLTASKTS
jgi:transcriptional regulator with XRE-family HTH domain